MSKCRSPQRGQAPVPERDKKILATRLVCARDSGGSIHRKFVCIVYILKLQSKITYLYGDGKM